jgi:phage anti-repressor protein
VTEIIPLTQKVFDGGSKPGVSAKRLYEFLELNPAHYARWTKRNITNNPYAIEHQDWEVIHPAGEIRVSGRLTSDYVLSIDLAKKLAMMTRTDKGEEARVYFLDCEKALQGQLTPVVHDPIIQAHINTLIEVDRVRMIAQEAQREASEAKDMALQTLHAVSWLAVAQYVYLHGLSRQVPPPQAIAFGKHLTIYCLERGIPMGEWYPYGKPYKKENTYPVSLIAQLLPEWLKGHHGQIRFEGIEEDGIHYGEQEP